MAYRAVKWDDEPLSMSSYVRLHSLCILQGGGQRILGGVLKFLEQKKGGYENCLNISGGMLIFWKILSSFCNGFKR